MKPGLMSVAVKMSVPPFCDDMLILNTWSPLGASPLSRMIINTRGENILYCHPKLKRF